MPTSGQNSIVCESMMMFTYVCVCVCAGSSHRQKRTELSVGQAGLRDPDAELGICHGGPYPPEGDYR